MPLADMARFELLDKLGEGGMGVVYAAYDRERHARVALKILRNVTARSLYRFKREFRALSDLSHPNIVALYELIAEGDEWAFTMELIDGCDFLEYLYRGRHLAPVAPPGPARALAAYNGERSFSTGVTQTSVSARSIDSVGDDSVPLESGAGLPTPPVVKPRIGDVVDVDRLRETFRQLAQALHFLHVVGIVHRDLKPSNVRVTPLGRVVVMDFGVAAEIEQPSDPELEGVRSGTPSFMAPEQVTGDAPTAAADWYSFGVMLYTALTGHRPYSGTAAQIMTAKRRCDPLPPNRFVKDIPDELEQLCLRLLVRDPEQRITGDPVLHALGMRKLPIRRTAETTLDTSTAAFVGRARELARLHEIHQGAESAFRDHQRAECVLIRGPSGIGKTTLVERFIKQLGDRACHGRVFTGRCHERETLPYKAFDGIVDDLGRYLLTLPDHERAGLLPSHLGVLTRLFPTLCRVPGCDPLEALPTRDPRVLRKKVVEALRTWLTRISSHQDARTATTDRSDEAEKPPIIIHVQDLQWADRNSLEVLIGLVEPPVPRSIMVVITTRIQDETGDDGTDRAESHGTHNTADTQDRDVANDEDHHSIDDWPVDGDNLALLAGRIHGRTSCHLIDVGPLGPDEQRELVMRISNQKQVRAWLDDQLWSDAAGHPMLLTELARYLQEEPDDQALLDQVQLSDVIWRRIEHLPSSARALVEVLAVAGGPTALTVLGEAGELGSNVRERAAAVLRISRLARRVSRDKNDQWVDVYHGMVREAAIAHLPAERVRELHARLATALEARGTATPSALAHHWLEAERGPRAAPYLMTLARREAEQLALDHAIERYRTVLSHVPEGVKDRDMNALRQRAESELAECVRQRQRASGA